jgi:hypothetical protein
MVPPTNPFATRHVRPGSIVPLDGRGAPLDIPLLVGRLRRSGGTGAIVGPHGSGKSTLLLRLAAEIEAGGTRVERVRVRGWRDVVRTLVACRAAGRNGTVCIDGWERLAGPLRRLVRLLARVTGRALVVTMHRRDSMPELATCGTTAGLLAAIVDRLPGRADWYGRLIGAEDIRAAFEHRHGDVREALFDLYDVFERRARDGVPRRS